MHMSQFVTPKKKNFTGDGWSWVRLGGDRLMLDAGCWALDAERFSIFRVIGADGFGWVRIGSDRVPVIGG